MRVLWIAPKGGRYKNQLVKGTGGWIGALEEQLTNQYPEMEIGIAFLDKKDTKPLKQGNVTYFPVQYNSGGGPLSRIVRGWFAKPEKEDEIIAKRMKAVIDLYQPDVVHVWGIEGKYPSVIPLIDRPFVVHIQGLLSLYIYIYLPYGFSVDDLHKADFPWRRLFNSGSYSAYKRAKYRAEREIKVAKYVKNWIGRTDWDYTASQLLSPGSKYYHCEEIMRSDFNGKQWQYHYDGQVIHIQSTVTGEFYKGFDVVLKTAKLLNEIGRTVDWKVYGISRDDYRIKYFVKKLDIIPEKYGIKCMGRVYGRTIRDGLLSSDMYVHASYIENSSNAIAEAMMLGVPTIAQNVGGNSSMLKDNSGVLVAPNEPYMLVHNIMRMCDRDISEGYSSRAIAVARNRQNATNTVDNLVNIYQSIIEGANHEFPKKQ